MEQAFLEFTAGLFGVSVDQISLDTRYREFDKWDSLMMLTLTMELEAKYGVTISMEEIERIQTLDDFYRIVASR